MQFQKKCNQYTSLCSWHNICVMLGEVKLGLFCRFSNFFFSSKTLSHSLVY